jgi:hypothetical protein
VRGPYNSDSDGVQCVQNADVDGALISFSAKFGGLSEARQEADVKQAEGKDEDKDEDEAGEAEQRPLPIKK